MRTGIIIGKTGGIDGVALESAKWAEALKREGHEVFILSGRYEGSHATPLTETLVPEMSFHSPESYWSQKKAFFYPDADPRELLDHINLYSKLIYKKIMEWVKANRIELLISENASSLPAHLEMGMAIRNVLMKTGMPAITHDHDFSWERGERFFSPHAEINRFVEEFFPLRLPNTVHAVINSHAKICLKARYSRQAIVVPNVMDFEKHFGQATEKNSHTRPANGGYF